MTTVKSPCRNTPPSARHRATRRAEHRQAVTKRHDTHTASHTGTTAGTRKRAGRSGEGLWIKEREKITSQDTTLPFFFHTAHTPSPLFCSRQFIRCSEFCSFYCLSHISLLLVLKKYCLPCFFFFFFLLLLPHWRLCEYAVFFRRRIAPVAFLFLFLFLEHYCIDSMQNFFRVSFSDWGQKLPPPVPFPLRSPLHPPCYVAVPSALPMQCNATKRQRYFPSSLSHTRSIVTSLLRLQKISVSPKQTSRQILLSLSHALPDSPPMRIEMPH